MAHDIYRNDPNWIAPLEKDIEGIFSAEKNTVLAHGEVIRWLLKEGEKTIGRVAAFINYKAVEAMEYPVGGMGFFECIDNEKAAFILFDAARKWLEGKGMKGMDGPINFGERDRFWGLLVQGFGPPSYMEAYNPSYYRKFFENYGFRLYFEQHTYLIKKEEFRLGRFEKIAKWVMRKPEYSFRHLEMDKLEKYAEDFVHIYNTSWQKFENFKPVSSSEILALFKEMTPIIIPEIIWFAYVEGEPAGFMIMVPDVNQVFRYVNGKLDLTGKLKFLYYKRTRPMNKVKGLVFGIIPKFQNLGLDAGMVYNFYHEIIKLEQYNRVGISWIGNFNPKMHSLMEALSARVDKVHYTYRKLFDESIVFKPYSIGEYSKAEGDKEVGSGA